MTLTTDAPDTRLLRDTFGHFPSGVVALAATVGGSDAVLVASSFTVGVSLEPPLVMFAVQKSSSTWPTLRQAGRIGVSVLGNRHGALCRQLSGKDKAARFVGVPLERTDGGAILVDGSAVRLECSIHAEYPAGDHDIVVLEVLAAEAGSPACCRPKRGETWSPSKELPHLTAKRSGPS